jgi:hypothetical protein
MIEIKSVSICGSEALRRSTSSLGRRKHTLPHHHPTSEVQ